MGSVLDLLSPRAAAFCLECIVTRTGLRADTAIAQINTLPHRVTEGRCGGCREIGPIFAHAAGSG